MFIYMRFRILEVALKRNTGVAVLSSPNRCHVTEKP